MRRGVGYVDLIFCGVTHHCLGVHQMLPCLQTLIHTRRIHENNIIVQYNTIQYTTTNNSNQK
jgi:hypothetical protein